MSFCYKKICLLIFFLSMKSLFAYEDVQLYLKWKHQFQFVGYYMAQKLGFYEKEGINVHIFEREPNDTIVDKVLKHKNSFGITDSSTVLHFLKGKPITIVATIFQHSPTMLVTLAESNILTPLELKGKKVMYQKDVDDSVVKGIFFNVGLHDGDYEAVAHTLTLEPLINKEVDALSIYRTKQPYYFEKKGIKVNFIDPTNYGIDFYGDQIFTSRETALKNTNLVKRFRRATLKGWNYALKNIDESVSYIAQTYKKDKNWLFYEAKETKRHILPNIIDLGTTSLNRLQRIRKIYEIENQVSTNVAFETILFDQLIKAHSFEEYIKKYLQPFLGLVIGGFFLVMIFNFNLKRKVDEKTKELEKAYKERDLFFSNITHELRTPLNGILGASEDLEASDLDQNQLELISIITYSGQHLLNIVNDLLEFSKKNMSEIKIVPRAIKLSKSLERLTLFYQRQARSKSLSFFSESRVHSDMMVYLDEKRILQVLHNLLSNALKFTEKGSIILRVQEDRKENEIVFIKFSVIDTGIGIEKENRQRIFEPFVQARGGIALGGYIGTGLGLPVAKEMVGLMGGELVYKENHPKGSIFEFTLPLKIFDEKKVDISQYEINVLVVDDIEINAKVLKSKLRKVGLKPESVLSGYECLEKLRSQKIDIIFTDYNMPGMNGKELVEAGHELCHELGKKPPMFVGCSAVDEGFNLGWDVDYELKKPYDSRDLLKIIDSYIRLQKD